MASHGVSGRPLRVTESLRIRLAQGPTIEVVEDDRNREVVPLKVSSDTFTNVCE